MQLQEKPFQNRFSGASMENGRSTLLGWQGPYAHDTMLCRHFFVYHKKLRISSVQNVQCRNSHRSHRESLLPRTSWLRCCSQTMTRLLSPSPIGFDVNIFDLCTPEQGSWGTIDNSDCHYFLNCHLLLDPHNRSGSHGKMRK